ncbi:MAG: AAA family ATPase [Armatimonadetes bacterium]|nr:AAA family ATPase [Armatimonadota bacterium]
MTVTARTPAVARTRITAPRPSPQALPRERLLTLLEDRVAGHRLVLVVAGPGFGKSTLLASWAGARRRPCAWLSLVENEDDPAYLVTCVWEAVRRAVPGLPEEPAAGRWRAAADALLNVLVDAGPLTLVLDDLHLLDPSRLEVIDYLVRFSPDSVRFLAGARSIPALPGLAGWRAREEAAVLGSKELVLTLEEIHQLLERRGADRERAAAISDRTGGWPLAVDFLSRRVQAGAGQPVLEDYLTAEIWSTLEGEEQELLLRCSVLEFFSDENAVAVSGAHQAPALLRRLSQQGVVLQTVGEGEYRIHPLFREFLQNRLGCRRELLEECHGAAAASLRRQGENVEAIPHLLAARRLPEAWELLAEIGPALLRGGRHQTLIRLVERLGPERLEQPELRLGYAHALRLSNRFACALEQFGQTSREAAGQGLQRAEALALAGLGQIYVDTVQPARAAHHLRRALRLLPPDRTEDKAAILLMMAENYLNQGSSNGALRFRRWARRLLTTPSHQSNDAWGTVFLGGRTTDPADARLLLRTGQLRAARTVLLARLNTGATPGGTREAHREDLLVLSYLHALEGEAEQAEAAARATLAACRELPSPFTEAVAWMRLGHALQLKQAPIEEVLECYSRGQALAETTGVERIKAEALMGQSLAYAAAGQREPAVAAAREALRLTRAAGDDWLSGWLLLAAGIAAEEELPLLEARKEFEKCRDPFGISLVSLWLGVIQRSELGPLLARLEEKGYGFVTERSTLFGPRRALVQPTGTDRELRIQCLGRLRVFRGGVEIENWKRKKARELLALLVHRGGEPCLKEQLQEHLWPDTGGEAANRNFKVVLHALSEALDPDRPRNATARCIERLDEAYRLRRHDSFSVDAWEFEELIRRAGQAQPDEAPLLWLRACNLYQGDFLADFPYCDWAEPDRQRLRALYLETGQRLAEGMAERGRAEEALAIAHEMLTRDPCWEQAYQVLIRVYGRTGRGFLAARAYEQCVQALGEELGVEPCEQTDALYQEAITGR